MSNNQSRTNEHQPKVELELENGTVEQTAESIGKVEDELNTLAEQTDAEYALVTIEPMTEDQHEANKALREHLENRNNE